MEAPARAATLNLPLPPGTDGDAYLATLDEALEAIRGFDPDAPIILSLGFDTYHADPICNLALRTDDYARIGSAIASLGKRGRRHPGGWVCDRRARRERRCHPRCPARDCGRSGHQGDATGVTEAMSALRRLPIVAFLLIGGCRMGGGAPPSDGAESSTERSDPSISRATCDDTAFDLAVLDQPGGAENGDDPASAALREHLDSGMETDFLPDAGWIDAVRTEKTVWFIAPVEGGLAQVDMQLEDGQWRASGWGGCSLRPEIPLGMNIATFRVAPGEALTAETTELDVLVTEVECNSGEDARGRVQEPTFIRSAESVTVIFTVVARPGGHDCQSNPATPIRLTLPEQLGDRVLLDGSSIPARDATDCEPNVCP